VHDKAARPHSVPTTTSLIVRPPGPTPTCHHFPAAPPQRARSILSPSPPTRSLSSLLLSPSPSLSRTFSLSPPPGGRGPRVSTGHGVGSVGARTAAGVAGHGVESANAPAAASVVALGAAAYPAHGGGWHSRLVPARGVGRPDRLLSLICSSRSSPPATHRVDTARSGQHGPGSGGHDPGSPSPVATALR
jgi:hypothetical protein